MMSKKKEISANEEQLKKANEIVEILQEAQKALLEKKPILVHTYMQLAITELMVTPIQKGVLKPYKP